MSRAVTVIGGPSDLSQAISAGLHHLLADEPKTSGGSDAGPDLYATTAFCAGIVHEDDSSDVRRSSIGRSVYNGLQTILATNTIDHFAVQRF